MLGRGLRGARLAAGVFQDFIPVIVKVGQLRQVRPLYVPRNCLTNKIKGLMTEEQQQYLSGYIEGAADGGDYDFYVDSVDYDSETNELVARLEPDGDSKFGKDLESVVRMMEDTLRGKDWGFGVFYEIKITVKRED